MVALQPPERAKPRAAAGLRWYTWALAVLVSLAIYGGLAVLALLVYGARW